MGTCQVHIHYAQQGYWSARRLLQQWPAIDTAGASAARAAALTVQSFRSQRCGVLPLHRFQVEQGRPLSSIRPLPRHTRCYMLPWTDTALRCSDAGTGPPWSGSGLWAELLWVRLTFIFLLARASLAVWDIFLVLVVPLMVFSPWLLPQAILHGGGVSRQPQTFKETTISI